MPVDKSPPTATVSILPNCCAVLRFHTEKGRRATNYLGRREQRRLLILVLMLGLVVILMVEASKPANWMWLWGVRQPGGGNGRGAVPADRAPRGLLAQLGEKAEPVPDGPPVRRKLLDGVDPQLLTTIRDDTIHVVRAEEQAAFAHLLGLLKTTEADRLEQAASAVSFVQLYNQPREYRGELVTITGLVHRSTWLPAAANLGVDGYYELWVQPDGESDPLVVYSLDLPAGFPQGAEVLEHVALSGFFFKRWIYMAQRDVMSAPVVLAKTVAWEPPAPAAAQAPEPRGLVNLIVPLLGALLIAAAFVAYVVYRTTPERSSPLVGQAAALSALKDEPLAPDPRDALRALEQESLETSAAQQGESSFPPEETSR